MNTLPKHTVRLRLDPLNPGHFFACCGLLELADRAWGGAEGWFEEHADFFCITPLEHDPSLRYGARALLEQLKEAKLTNTLMSEAQMKRREELTTILKKAKKEPAKSDSDTTRATSKALIAEMKALEALWDHAKDTALCLSDPFNLLLDWYLDGRTGAGRFKTWAGQQNITAIAFELKRVVDAASFDDAELDWLFTLTPCQSSLHLDAVGAGTDIDVGFSFDPLQIRSPEKRPLVELLAFIGLQRFPPRQLGEVRAYPYSAWLDPLSPAIAHAAARGFGTGPSRTFEFRLLYRSKYLKSFLPAQPRRDHR